MSCEYRLELSDSYGDGWNGSILTVTVAGISTDYTIIDGSFEAFTFLVSEGDNIVLEYAPGTFELEVSYVLFDSDGVPIFSDGPLPAVGEVFSTVATCPVCPRPQPTSLTVLATTDHTASLSWGNPPGAMGYIVEYGPAGFPVGSGLIAETPGPFIALDSLNPCVDYDFYVYS
ncbi:MAG: hypothetical protein D6714_09595, partial [Bacteroidetes bacterium]